ncbi:tetratricopeptide repeat protein, partial [candidate division WOR-3 bacterium]|nr:tetratricopeptide repeat protein [candidate division WOR-3 bacterium]
ESETSGSPEIYLSSAESLYLEVKKEYPGFSSVNIGLGNIHIIRGEYDSALSYISAAVRENPSNYFLLNKLAFIYSALGDDKTALILLERAVQMKPDYDEANANLAVLYFLRNNFERSYALYLSTEMTPRNEKVMKNLGVAFSVLRGEEINGFVPEMMDAVKLLGDAGLFEEKYTLLKIMAEQRPDNPDVLFDLALCAALDLGEVQTSLSVFDLGVKMFPEDSRFLRGKGLLYLSLGDTANSVLMFEEYIEKFPKDSFHSDISEFLEKIKYQPI